METVLNGLEGPDKFSPASIIHNPVAGTRFAVRAGEQVTGVFEIVNDTSSTANFHLDLVGLKESWYRSRGGQDAYTEVAPFNSGWLTLDLVPPPNAASHNYDFTVRIVRDGPMLSDGTAVSEPISEVPLVLSVTGAARAATLPLVDHMPAKPMLRDLMADAAAVALSPRGDATSRNVTLRDTTLRDTTLRDTTLRDAMVLDAIENKDAAEAEDLASEPSVRDPEDGKALPVRPGETLLLLFPFTNDTDHTRTYVIYEDRSLDHDWIEFENNRVNLNRDKSGHVSIRLTPPLEALPGTYPFMVQIGPEGGVLTARHLTLRVLAAPAILLSALARQVRGSQFRSSVDFNLLVESAGNADTAFRLAVNAVESQDGSGLLRVGDLQDPRGLMDKLQDQDHSVSLYLRSQSPALKWVQDDHSSGSTLPSRRLKKRLAATLNQLLRGECLYQEAAFHQVQLTAETKHQLGKHQLGKHQLGKHQLGKHQLGKHQLGKHQQNQSLGAWEPGGEELIRLNRLLLEDAYPQEIARHTAVIRKRSGQRRQEVYETAQWRYLFDREIDSLESAAPNQPPPPRRIRLRLVRKGIWWSGCRESHTVSVCAVPVTDTTNGGKTGNWIELTAVRQRLNPVPVSTLLPLLFLPLLVFFSQASTLDIQGMPYTTDGPSPTVVNPVTYTGYSGGYPTSYIVGTPDKDHSLQAKLTWKARSFALLRLSDSSADDQSGHRNPFVIRGWHQVFAHFKEGQVSINSFYEINRLIGWGGPALKVKYIAARPNTNLVIETAQSKTAQSDTAQSDTLARFNQLKGRVDPAGIEEIELPVPIAPNAHAILKLTNNAIQDNALDYWVVNRDKIRPFFIVRNLNNEGSLRPTQQMPIQLRPTQFYPQGRDQVVYIYWTGSYPVKPEDHRLVLVTTDAKRPVVWLNLKVAASSEVNRHAHFTP